MARLTLFGDTRDFTTGGESYPGFGGAPQNLLQGRLAADQRSLDLGFSGELPQAHVVFRAIFGCQVVEGEIQLTQVLSTTQAPSVELRLFTGGPLPSPTLVIDPALLRSGIGFRDTRNSLRGRMQVLRPPVSTLFWQGLGGWTGNVVGFDVARDEMLFRPESIDPKPGVVFVDELVGEQPPDLTHRQELRMSLIRIGAAVWTASFQPSSGALFLHPDVLDTTFVQRHDSEGRELPNDLLYQYALANGSLEIDFDPDSLTDHQVFWRGHQNSEEPLLVCFRLQDESGHPLLLSSRDRSFRIGHRDGITLEVAQRDLTDEWEQTNRAALIEALPAPGATEGRIPCRVRTLDPLKLPRGPRLRNSLTNPYWLQGGRVPISDRSPREIHGLAQGVFLRRAAGNGDLSAEIATSAVHEDGFGKLFVRTELVLPSAEGWTLFAQTEERELAAVAQQGSFVPEVGMRSAAGRNDGELRLPLIDTSYAFANLAGQHRVQRDGQGESTGERLGSGVLLAHGHRWIEAIDRQMAGADPECFTLPSLTEQTHTSGFGERPAADQPFHAVVDRPPTQAATPAATARTGAWLQATSPPAAPVSPLEAALAPGAAEVPLHTSFAFGGQRGQEDVLQERLRSNGSLGQALERFQRIWADDRELQPRQREALAALRGVLVEPRPADVSLLPPSYFEEALGRARELARSNLPVPWLAEIQLAVEDWFPEDLAREWSEGSDPIAVLLCEFLWAPPSVELFRRATSLLFPERGKGGLTPEKITEALPEPLRNPDLQRLLRQDLVPFVPAWEEALTKNLEGFLAEVAQGVDGRYDEMVQHWRSGAGELLDELRRKYGPELSPDVYTSLLQAAADATALVDVLRDFGIELERLADLKNDPPDYLLITRRFRTVGQPDSRPTDALWNHRFDLCDFGDKRWHFFLDSDSTAIVKLTGARTLPEILKEAEAAYRTPGRPNPLGVPANLLPRETASPAEVLIARLHPDLLARDWRGVLVIAPMADIAEDLTLRNLAGLEYIQAAYVALGGRKPGNRNLDLDVYANIFQQAGVRHEDKESHVQFALVKFDATIKHTEIESGEIVFQIDLKDLWGRKMEGDFKSGPVFVRGTLPRETKKEGKERRSFEFAAWFEQPFEARIDVAFVHAFLLRAIRVGRAQGQTSLEIDGDLVLRKTGIDLPIDLPGGDETRLALDGFRILLPDPGKGLKIPLGRARALNFDFPALSFRLPKQRVFNIWGIELELLGMGYIRNAPKALEDLRADHWWIEKLEIPETDDFVFPYLDLRVDFGKIPRFGGIQAGGLTFRGVIGVQWKHGDNPQASFGLRRLDAKDLRFELFRFLVLEIEKLHVGPWTAQLPGEPVAEVGAILAKDVRLKILDWSPLPEKSELSAMFLQPRDLDSRQNGLLAWYQNHTPRGGKFFHLDWLLFAHNLKLPTKVHDTLLSGRIETVDIQRSFLDELVDEENSKIQARLLDHESWIFGASFALGKIFDRCSFILHDQHYYGIRLAADWVEAAFGVPAVELAYIPGTRRELDRFRTSLRIPALDLLGTLKSGELALEWGINWDFMIDVGFPWQRAGGYDWLRSFSLPVGIYEARFGFYLEKRNQLSEAGNKQLVLSAGVGFYLGYQFGYSSSIVWLRAGIGVFALFQGRAVLEGTDLLKASLVELEVVGVVGIFAYGEGGIDVWILSARFRVTLQAALALSIHYRRNLPCVVTYGATLSAGYSASVRIGSGWFSWTFSVSGHVNIGVSGRLLLS